MFAVSISAGRVFEHGAPHLLFAIPGVAQQEYFRSYDVHPDGKRFLMEATGGGDAKDLDVIFNWRAELLKIKDAPK